MNVICNLLHSSCVIVIRPTASDANYNYSLDPHFNILQEISGSLGAFGLVFYEYYFHILLFVYYIVGMYAYLYVAKFLFFSLVGCVKY